jgi:hypothetical protein
MPLPVRRDGKFEKQMAKHTREKKFIWAIGHGVELGIGLLFPSNLKLSTAKMLQGHQGGPIKTFWIISFQSRHD